MSEKRRPAETTPLLRERTQRFPKTRLLTVLGLVAAISIIRPFFQPEEPTEHLPLKTDNESVSWSWDKVEPSRELKWEKCYNDEFECARLDVPMDWLDPTEDKRVVLGVIKLAAKQKGGNFSPVFTNPGGPGGSGVKFMQRGGRHLQTIIGDNHDIISFDPRGVGVSTPRVECWGTSQKRKLWSMQEVSVFDQHPGLIYDHYARAMAYSGACEEAMNETGIMRHLSTPSLARDMLEILNKTGHSKLRYWGFSYGTILGGVFAGLFPDRVERLISDGNCDYTDWFNLDHANFMSDTDLIFDAFDTYCHKAGPKKCAFWDESAQAIQDRRSALLESLKMKPILIPAWSRPTGPELPVLATYSKVQLLTRTVIYKPIAKFPNLAEVYAALERGDGIPFYDMVTDGGSSDSDIDLCTLGDTPATMPQEKGTEEDAFPAIMCSDNVPLNYTAEEFADFGKRLQGVSRWAGAANLLFRVVCLGKTVRPKWTFSVEDFKSDTAHPILFIGNMADNVTPLQSAYNNSAHFPSSVVLRQNSYGHCSSAQPSKCTAKYIRAYFQNGTLPAAGTECESDYELFQLPMDEAAVMGMDDLENAMFKLASEVDIGPMAF